jgi:hypothetical protein
LPSRSESADFAAPVFGIKAKQKYRPQLLRDYFAAPVFGIKAKPSMSAIA